MDIINKIKKYSMITFLNKNYVNGEIKGPLSCFKRFKFNRLKKKLLEKNIHLFILSNADEYIISNNSNIQFDNLSYYRNNELYFKLCDYDPLITRFYSIDNISKEVEKFKQELFYTIISNFGLKKATLEYITEDTDTNTVNIKSTNDISYNNKKVFDADMGIQLNNFNKVKKKIISVMELENTGSISLFKCYINRPQWCEEKFKDIQKVYDIVKNILKDKSEFSFKSYLYDRQLHSIIYSRCNGLDILTYDITSNKTFDKTYKFFTDMGVEFSKFGYNLNISGNIENKKVNIKHKIIHAEFYKIDELEQKTLENLKL
tara:strand:- start:72 stop:1022 length:951 start_codon:yes stop_codon:yes gene_type:complete